MALFSECMRRCGKKVLDNAGVVRDAILNVQDYDLSDHQFVRLTLGPQKDIPRRIVLVPRELVISIYEGKHASSMLGFAGAKDKSPGIFPY
jgi:hypothetical protein